jgi:hypothetical protein
MKYVSWLIIYIGLNMIKMTYQSYFRFKVSFPCPQLTNHHAMKMYWKSAYTAPQLHVFLTSALDRGEWSASCPGSFPPWVKAPGTHWIGGWVDPRAGLNAVAKRENLLTTPAGNRTPASQPVALPLCRLSYRGSKANEKFSLCVTKHYPIRTY